MNNEIIISNVNPQDIIIGEGGAAGITDVLVNDVSVVENNIAYVVVPTKLSELQNNTHFISQETDPTVPYVVKQITTADINRWNSKQEQLISGVNIKTINNNSILGEGNINVDKTYTAGTGINITDENVINNTITSYNDLDDLPTIPTKISDLLNDSDFVESSELSNVAFSGSYLDLSNTPDLSLYATLDTDELLNYYTKDFFFKILPKVSGNGTSITLNDTIDNTQMYLTLGASELTQDETPTPSSPQDIHTISGSNKVIINGSQLFDKDNADIVTGYIDGTTGELLLGETSKATREYIPIIPNIDMNISGFNNIVLAFYNKDKTFIERVLTASSSYTFNRNAYYIRIQGTGDTFNADAIMLNKGTSALPYEPYTSQEADIDLSSKNLLSLKNLQKSGWNLYFDNPMKEAGDYTISCESEIYVNPTAQGFALAFQNEIGGSDIGTYFTGYSFGREIRETSKTITQEQAEAKYIVLKPNGEGLSPSAIREAKTMLNKGNAKIPYVEYYEPINYCKIGNYEDKFIRTSGKNLFDASAISLNKYVDGSNGNLADSSSSNASDYIEVEENKTYTISYDYSTLVNTGNRAICFYNSSKTFLSYTTYTTTNKTNNFTIPSNAKYIRLTLDKNCYDIMIYEGSTTLDYEPYGSNEWYIKKNIGKVVLDGSEDGWALNSLSSGSNYLYWLSDTYYKNVFINVGDYIDDSDATNRYLVDKFKPSLQATTETNNGSVTMYNHTTVSWILFNYSNATTVEDFKTWLSTHNTIVYYQLATPTYTKITGTLAEQLENVYQKMLSQKGQTNISQVNNDLPFVISAVTLKDMSNL